MDRLIVPVHLGMHWTCAVVDLEHREIRYYDSMAVRDTEKEVKEDKVSSPVLSLLQLLRKPAASHPGVLACHSASPWHELPGLRA